MSNDAPRRISPWVALVPAAAIAVLLTLGTPLLLGQNQELPSAMINKPAPSLQVEPIEGQTLPTDAMLADGQVKLVNFWASWCGPCRVEHPQLMDLAATGLPIIGLNYKDEDANALGFLRQLGNPYTASGSVDGRAAVEWGVYGVPETYLIDDKGNIRLRIAGPVTDVILRTQLAPALENLR